MKGGQPARGEGTMRGFYWGPEGCMNESASVQKISDKNSAKR